MDLKEHAGYTYATIRTAFNRSSELVYEYGDMGDINISSILTKAIQDVGRFSENWSSDVVYAMDMLRDLSQEKKKPEEEYDEVFVFGIRKDGVDCRTALMHRLLESRDPGPFNGFVHADRAYRRVLAVRVRLHADGRADFSLRDISNGFSRIDPVDMEEGRLKDVPFADGRNPQPSGDGFAIDPVDIERIRKNGYVRFEAAELEGSDLVKDGCSEDVGCTGIYGSYPDGISIGKSEDNCVCRIYRVSGSCAVCWTNRWYECYPEAKELVRQHSM